MPVDLSVKQVPDEVAERLRKRAQRNHRSLQGELRAILEAAAEVESIAELYAVARRELRPASHVVAPRSESALIIREDRDGRHFTIDDLFNYVQTLGSGTPDESVGWIRSLRSTR
jgi:plasmid stability protein